MITLNTLANILGILSFFLTLLTLVATLNVRSQIIHSEEKKNFKSNRKNIVGKLNGFLNSLLTDNLNSNEFYQSIDLYMVDLLSKYTFLHFTIRLKCKSISHCIQNNMGHNDFKSILAKQLTQLINLIAKENCL